MPSPARAQPPIEPYGVATPLSPAGQLLERPFKAIVFDWDGTAVADRHEDASVLAGIMQELLRLGVWLVIVTGTNIDNIHRQLGDLIAPGCRRHLLICTNRGSEVYGFRPSGATVRRWLRVATPEEDQALTAIAESVRDALVARTGLDVRIVYDRLNRRKIDLIPVPEWADPPKSRIGELLVAAEERLRGGGLAGGLGEAVELTRRLAQERGLPDARITSDVKHIEVGLTDKGDSLAWVWSRLLRPKGIAPEEVLIAGDEFGPIAGFPGSDDRLRAQAAGAVVVSVGKEPNGVPDGVIHVGGGPVRFRALLMDQVGRHRSARAAAREIPAGEDWVDAALLVPADPAWRLEQHGYEPALEHEVESRFAVSNGFLGVRGSVAQPTAVSQPRTYVAGLFDTPPGPYPMPVLAPGPDWLRLQLGVDGTPLTVTSAAAPAHPRILDFQRAVLASGWNLRDEMGPVGRVHALRFASQADRAIAVQLIRFEVERPLWVTVEAWLDQPPGTGLIRVQHLEQESWRRGRVDQPPGEGLVRVRDGREVAVWRTAHDTKHLAVAASASLTRGGTTLESKVDDEPSRRRWSWVATPEEPAFFVRIAAMARSDTAAGAADEATAALSRARHAGPHRLLDAHARAWAGRWAASDVAVEGDAEAQRALRFAAYHLMSAANPDDERVSIGARALTGDAYRGHVFWDTEIFLLPFYTYTWPAAARALLMYRYHTLPGARAKAARLGYRGALYAWESTDTGDEATPPWVIGPDGQVISIRCGTEEHHISADVAYAVWQFWQATEDTGFLLAAGAEILLETARFWASRAGLEDDGRYHIRDVIGPDEYHEGVDDNAYTNEMARWNIERGLEVAALLEQRWPERWNALRGRLDLTAEELAQWREVADRLANGFDPAIGLFEQFAGFFTLEPIDLAAYEPRTLPMDVLLGPERTRRSQVIKQADVVMLMALLWNRYPAEVRAANFRYYERRCGHGSSLSPAMHALVAARLGDVELAERYFDEAAAIDLDDSMGNTAGGVHMATLGGLWQAAVFGFMGFLPADDGVRFDPRLPETWRVLRTPLRWRGRLIRAQVQRVPLSFTVTLDHGQPLTVNLGGLRHRLRRGQSWTCRWDRRADCWLEAAP